MPLLWDGKQKISTPSTDQITKTRLEGGKGTYEESLWLALPCLSLGPGHREQRSVPKTLLCGPH